MDHSRTQLRQTGTEWPEQWYNKCTQQRLSIYSPGEMPVIGCNFEEGVNSARNRKETTLIQISGSDSKTGVAGRHPMSQTSGRTMLYQRSAEEADKETSNTNIRTGENKATQKPTFERMHAQTTKVVARPPSLQTLIFSPSMALVTADSYWRAK